MSDEAEQPTAHKPVEQRSVDKPRHRSQETLRWIKGEGRRRTTLSEDLRRLALSIKK